jgi:Ras-related protein Rab-28
MADSDDEGPTKEHQLKVVLVGDGTAGKTSIITRFCQNNFDKTYNQTIGIDFFLKRIMLPGDRYVSLQVWDIGGQTLGGKMLDNYLAGAHIIMFVYDVTNFSSFENLDDWRLHVEKCVKDSEAHKPKFALVANKSMKLCIHVCTVTSVLKIIG